MPINPDAVGLEAEGKDKSWKAKDAMLYALGLGCGVNELQFSTEKNQQVLPTMAVVLGGGGGELMSKVGEFNPAMLLHGEQAITLHKPIPVKGTTQNKSRVAAIWDKGKGAVITLESEAREKESGELLFSTRSSVFIRGAGDFGGERGPSVEPFEAPGEPDHQVKYQTTEDQALIYRLSGDYNPLHSDPEYAKMGGLDKPILHGLCTYGFTGRALLEALCDNQVERFKSIEGRFSKSVYPGDELTINIWVDGNEAKFQTLTQRGEVVIDHGKFTFS
jgi:acyl dehydratase